MNIEQTTVLHGPTETTSVTDDGVIVLLDPDAPRWVASDARGEEILGLFDGSRTVAEVGREYAARHDLPWSVAWQHVDTLAQDAVRAGFLRDAPPDPGSWSGRTPHLADVALDELWIHTNQLCNLSCRHCLVSSGPDGEMGLPREALLDVIEQGRRLGVKRFYFTGGEPLVRPDLVDLLLAVLENPEAELAVLTNGTLLRGSRLEAMGELPRDRVRLQVSLDGPGPEVNDPIRGAGSFERIVTGIKNAREAGFQVTVTTAIARANAAVVPEVTRLLGEIGVDRHHLLWLHKRGRAGDAAVDHTPAVDEVIAIVRRATAVGREVGVVIDNVDAMRERVNAHAGIKRDLSNACVSNLCVYSDGNVYPSASMVDIPELLCGSILESSLEETWRGAEVAGRFRAATLEDKEICRTCPVRYICGGGDTEHAYFYGGSLLAHDPYCDLHQAMISDALTSLARERRPLAVNDRSGFDAPVLYTAMGEGSLHCANDEELPGVFVSHSECVRSFELDAPREKVREFYGEAAEEPQEDLCCPVRPTADDIAHIPEDVVARFYGCGSPVGLADIRPGETTLDLGSGAGIDVFIAARKVGAEGRALGVDMTDRMLSVARENQPKVAANLGYDVVEFLEGFLEEIPVEDATVDVLTSNCVINLSPDKKRVFAEMWRVLRDHGRIVVSDIVSEEEVPPHQRQDPRLWGECISGALTEDELLADLERAGFHGVEVLEKTSWKEVEGYRFNSVTVRGYRFERSNGCVYVGQTATYRGPLKSVTDEEGHHFPRGVPVVVCTDTAAKLLAAPYAGMFLVAQPDGTVEAPEGGACCTPGTSCC